MALLLTWGLLVACTGAHPAALTASPPSTATATMGPAHFVPTPVPEGTPGLLPSQTAISPNTPFGPLGPSQPLPDTGPTRTSEPEPPPSPDLSAPEQHPLIRQACQQPSREEALAFTLDVLDTLYRHPNTPDRPVLLEAAASALYSFTPIVPMPWLFRTWVEEGVLPSLWHAPPSGPRPSIPEAVSLTPVDVEGDGSLEWLVAVSACASTPLPHLAPYGDLLVVWPAEQQHISLLDALSTYHFPEQNSSGPHRLPEVKGVGDLTEDGRPEIVLLYRSAGATTDFERLHVLSWSSDGFRDLVTTAWEPQNGGWSVADSNGDTVAELIGEDRGPGSAAAGPFPPYQLIYELVHDEYVPTRIRPLFPAIRPDSAKHPVLLWREAHLFARTGFRQEALARLQELTTLPPRRGEGIPDLRPYAMFP
ncbi:MAG: hypothetical protein Q9O62_14780 [Ardenticatenia bacterium]|nr:hypothetical protein [Ardenticatenia bacterium]